MIFENLRVLGCIHFVENYRKVSTLTRTVYDYEIDFHLSGDRHMAVEGRDYHITADTCVFRRPGEHVTGSGTSYDAYCLTLDLSGDDDVCEFSSRKNPRPVQKSSDNPIINSLPSCFKVEHPQVARELFEELSALCMRAEKDGEKKLRDMSAEKLLLFLASEAINLHQSGENSPLRREIAEAKEMIFSNFFEDISVDAMAKHFGFSTEHFIRLFKKELGYTPAEFLIRVRMENARHLLRFTKSPISEVAAMCGYSNFAFFSQTFRRRFGMAPTEYRNASNHEA